MEWIEPKGYLFVRDKRLGYRYGNKASTLIGVGFIASLFWLNHTHEKALFIKLLVSMFAIAASCYLFRYVLISLLTYFNGLKVPIYITNTAVVRGGDGVICYLNEIDSYDFKQNSVGRYSFYECHVKMKPMRSRSRPEIYFGIPVDYFEENKESIEASFNRRPTAKEQMSAEWSD